MSFFRGLLKGMILSILFSRASRAGDMFHGIIEATLAAEMKMVASEEKSSIE